MRGLANREAASRKAAFEGAARAEVRKRVRDMKRAICCASSGYDLRA